jgi:hypothetical protein
MRHKRAETPAYILWVEQRPTGRGKGKDAYFSAVKAAAAAAIRQPIQTPDVEVEIVYTTTLPPATRIDTDNVNKPTLDALKGVAYLDDRQVRAARVTLFDRHTSHQVAGRVEQMGRLFYSAARHVVLITIYSDTRLAELGGEDAVKQFHHEAWTREFNRAVSGDVEPA